MVTAALVWQKDSNFDARCTERIVVRRPSAHRVVGTRRRAVNQLQTKICAHPPRCQQSMDCHPPRDECPSLLRVRTTFDAGPKMLHSVSPAECRKSGREA